MSLVFTLNLSQINHKVQQHVPPDSPAPAVARLLALPFLVLEMLVQVAGAAAAEDRHGAGGHGWIQALLLAYLGLQGGWKQAHPTGSPERPEPGRFGCGDGGLPHPCKGLELLPELPIVGVSHGVGGCQEQPGRPSTDCHLLMLESHWVTLLLIAVFGKFEVQSVTNFRYLIVNSHLSVY